MHGIRFHDQTHDGDLEDGLDKKNKKKIDFKQLLISSIYFCLIWKSGVTKGMECTKKSKCFAIIRLNLYLHSLNSSIYTHIWEHVVVAHILYHSFDNLMQVHILQVIIRIPNLVTVVDTGSFVLWYGWTALKNLDMSVIFHLKSEICHNIHYTVNAP